MLDLIHGFALFRVDLASLPFLPSNFFFFPSDLGFPKFFRPNLRSRSLCSWQIPDPQNFRPCPELPATGPSGHPRNFCPSDLPAIPGPSGPRNFRPRQNGCTSSTLLLLRKLRSRCNGIFANVLKSVHCSPIDIRIRFNLQPKQGR